MGVDSKHYQMGMRLDNKKSSVFSLSPCLFSPVVSLSTRFPQFSCNAGDDSTLYSILTF